MNNFNFLTFFSDRVVGCFMEDASYCCFRKAVSNNFFQQVLLINIISTYANLLYFCSLFVDRKKTMESVHCERRRLLVAVLNTCFSKVLLINYINT